MQTLLLQILGAWLAFSLLATPVVVLFCRFMARNDEEAAEAYEYAYLSMDDERNGADRRGDERSDTGRRKVDRSASDHRAA